MSAIKQIIAREILDSRGNPTVQVELWTENGGYGIANVPSGASTGSKEALELRDKGTKYEKNWFGGKGVMTAVDNINLHLAPQLIGLESLNQRELDNLLIKLDGTANKDKYGANALLGISLANAHASASEIGLPLYRYLGGVNASLLPLPMLNVLNGGAHASNTVDFQEFMIMPVGAKTFKEALQMANHVFHNLAKILKANGHGTQVGDEGGFAPNAKSHEEVLDYLIEAIKKANYVPATKGNKAIAIAIDAASSEFYDESKKLYTFKKLKKAIDEKRNGFEKLSNVKLEFTSAELLKYYENLIAKYPIISIEDGFAENDWKGFEKFTAEFGDKIQIVGDDLTVTNPKLLQKAIDKKAMNSILIKLNQIGTLTETIDAIQLAQVNNMTAIVSHRSGETEDSTIADLAVALNTGQIKTGSLSRSDRIAKYNRLLQIEEELDSSAQFKGLKSFYNINK
ncbi:Enolase [Mycoplasmopsis meleagridis]|uniref:Enolase n=1 Tax=Mycoplasmopsis meleagridis ATCC 25294 TaxID=1264554 RepID=A0A0F5H2G8_9BACT|nr:phosphopyruvate hydratase [Mycoplasmopsis meleagridis]KKB27017.1 Enolase [Mycoplasmopsis meleagridis ATCC 25294]KUH47284.1 enolase [Mycoplasmopsis meleagridis]OAD18365.1 Enolase [Mycoplasmopsis meleagridis]VEU77494.1 Enolase [Mycoplasmopsis meleagridis]